MPSCTLQDSTVDASFDFKDSVAFVYQADLGEVIENPLLALAMAQSLGPSPVPDRRANLPGTFLFCNSINGQRTKEHRNVWNFTATFGPPPEGQDEEQQDENPLLRPPVYNISYIEEEYVVREARNVEELGLIWIRSANTLGPIVNAALIRPDEPIVATRRKGVIQIEKNFANLGSIMDFNEAFFETTNSDSVVIGSKTFAARRLKFEVAQSGGKQVENEITFYPAMIEISIHDTTDLIVDNVGYQYYDEDELKRFVDQEGNDTAEPQNLNLDASAADADSPTQITYRYLDEVAYAGFFS